jgi:hypothetical protein
MSVADVASVIAATGAVLGLATSIYAVVYQSRASDRLERIKWVREELLDDVVSVKEALAKMDLTSLGTSEPAADTPPDHPRPYYYRLAELMKTSNVMEHLSRVEVLGPGPLSDAAKKSREAVGELLMNLVHIEIADSHKACTNEKALAVKQCELLFTQCARAQLGM